MITSLITWLNQPLTPKRWHLVATTIFTVAQLLFVALHHPTPKANTLPTLPNETQNRLVIDSLKTAANAITDSLNQTPPTQSHEKNIKGRSNADIYREYK